MLHSQSESKRDPDDDDDDDDGDDAEDAEIRREKKRYEAEAAQKRNNSRIISWRKSSSKHHA